MKNIYNGYTNQDRKNKDTFSRGGIIERKP